MTKLVRALPSRSLTFEEVEDLREKFDQLEIAPMSFLPEIGLVYSLLLGTDDTTYLVGFNEHEDAWERITSADSLDEEGFPKLEEELNEWIDDKYDGHFENHSIDVDPDDPDVAVEQTKEILEGEE